MKHHGENTPPSSINGDDISEAAIYVDDMEEIQFDDDDIEEVMDQEEEDGNWEPPEDNAIITFDKHVGSVFCCDLHPDGKLAVTGGEDDKAYVWSVENGHIIMDCVGHKDSVIFVGFSFDGAFLATADMSGLIKVWKCNLEANQQAWTMVFEYEANDLAWGMWHFGTRVLMCGSVTGDIYVFKVPSGETKVLQGHNIKTECGKLFQDGLRLAAGYEDGMVKVWDLKSNSVLQHITASVHQIRITAIDTHPDNNLMASISTDGNVVLTTSTTGKIVGQLNGENDLEAVSFSPDSQYVALGTLLGSVTIWDVARQMLRHHCAKVENDDSGVAGVTKMFWVKNNLVTGCLDGSIRIYDGRSGEKKMMLTGHRSEVLDLCFNAKENLILTTSDDGTARIFKYEGNKEND